jgi:hypothetical protein
LAKKSIILASNVIYKAVNIFIIGQVIVEVDLSPSIEGQRMESLYCSDCKYVKKSSKNRAVHMTILAVLWLLTTTALFHYWLGLMFLIAALFYSATTKQKSVDARGSCGSEDKNSIEKNAVLFHGRRV